MKVKWNAVVDIEEDLTYKSGNRKDMQGKNTCNPRYFSLFHMQTRDKQKVYNLKKV